jgi:hypothetical protein
MLHSLIFRHCIREFSVGTTAEADTVIQISSVPSGERWVCIYKYIKTACLLSLVQHTSIHLYFFQRCETSKI